MMNVSRSHLTNVIAPARSGLPTTANRATSDSNAKDRDALVALSKLVEQRKTGLTTLNRQRSAEADARKARALAKVEVLKQRLRELSRYGMYPRLVAQQAAQIARELKAAAKDYAAAARASGSVGSLATAVAPVPTGAVADTADTAAMAADSKTYPTGSATTGAEPIGASEDKREAGGPDADGSHPTPGAGNEPNDGRDPIAGETRDATSAGFDKSLEASDAMRRFRELARDLKGTIERAVRQLKKQNADDRDAAQAIKAEAELRDTLDNLGKAMREEIAAAADASNGSDVTVPTLVDLAV